MIRAVIDTNLIISYLLTQSDTTSRLISHWERGDFVYLISPTMLAELQAVIQRPRLRQQMRVNPLVLLELIEQDTELVMGKLILTGVCRDPKDDHFIACAVEGQANYLVTGDKDLLDIERYQTVNMIKAYEFVTLLANQA